LDLLFVVKITLFSVRWTVVFLQAEKKQICYVFLVLTTKAD